MRKALAIILYVAIGFPALLGGICMVSVRPWALDRTYIKGIVSSPALYRAIAEAPSLGAGLEDPMDPDGGTVVVGGMKLDEAALWNAVRINLPMDAIVAAGSGAVDGFFDMAEGKTPPAPLVLDLRELKAGFAAKRDAIVSAYLAGLPVQEAVLAPGDLSFRPEGIEAQRMALAGGAAFERALELLPDYYRAKDDDGKALAIAGGNDLRALFDRAMFGALGLGAAMLAAAAFLFGKGGRSRLGFGGVGLVVPSSICLAIGVVCFVARETMVSGIIGAGPAGEFLQGPAGKAAVEYIAGALSPVASGFFIPGLVGASIGGLLVSLRRIVEKED